MCGIGQQNYSQQHSQQPGDWNKSQGENPQQTKAPSEAPSTDPRDIGDNTRPSETERSQSIGGQGGNNPLLDAINDARREHGLNPLRESTRLNEAAEANDAENNRTGNLGHHIDLGKYGSGGEITAMASGGITANQAVQMWLNSPGHRAILLDPNQTEVGVSISGNFSTADFR